MGKSGHRTNLTRTAAVGAVAVLILMMLLVTPVTGVGHDDGEAGTQIVVDDSATEFGITQDSTIRQTATGPYYSVENFEITGSGKGSRGLEAGDTIALRATIKNTGDETGVLKVVTFKRVDILGNEFYVDDASVTLSPGESTTVVRDYQTDDTQGGDITFAVDTGDEFDSKTVTLCCEPEAEITDYVPTHPNIGESVEFTGSGSDPDDEKGKGYRFPGTFEWGFDTYTYTETGRIVTHSFISGGDKTVKLRVTDNDGQTETAYTTVTVNHPPTAGLAFSPANPTVGQEVHFHSDASSDTDGTIESFEWDLDGDGTFETTGATPTTTYTSPGPKEVFLRVTDDDGSSSTGSITVPVNEPPTASFDYTPKPPVPGESAEFTAEASSDSDGTIQSYEWDFDGDGTTDATGKTVNRSFATKGAYDVRLTVTDDDSASTTTSETVPVTEPPTASIEHSPSPVITGETAEFNASAGDSDGTVESYEWDFDSDGNTDATGESVERSFGTTGEHEVSLTVTDDTGASTTVSKTVTVTDRPNVGIDYAPSPAVIQPEDSLDTSATFTPSSGTSDPDGSIESYKWRVDGEVAASFSSLGYRFETPGEHEVSLTVTDNDGATATATVTVTATYLPEGSIVHSSPLFTGQEAEFTADASDRDGTIVGYEWDFDGDDIADATGETVKKTFNKDGENEVSLTLTDDDGASTTITKTVTVSSIEYTPSEPNVGEFVKLTPSLNEDELNGTTEWLVDGETVASSGSGLTTKFRTPGDHNVTLVYTDENGETKSVSTTIPVNGPPNAAFEVQHSGDVADVGEWVSFDAGFSSDAERDDLTYKWDLKQGSGGSAKGEVVRYKYSMTGNKRVTLTVTDEHGLSDTDKKTVEMGDRRNLGRENAENNRGTDRRNRGRDWNRGNGGDDQRNNGRDRDWNRGNDRRDRGSGNDNQRGGRR